MSVAALAEQPMNEATVLAQTEQTFPHVLEMRGGIRTSAPRSGLETTTGVTPRGPLLTLACQTAKPPADTTVLAFAAARGFSHRRTNCFGSDLVRFQVRRRGSG